MAYGNGLMLHGANGTGKTSLMCEIGKGATARGYKVQYFTAQQYIDVRNGQSTLELLHDSAKFILLDEIDKVYIKQSTGFTTKALEEFIRRALSESKCVLICTNLDRKEFADTFGDSVASMIKRHMRVVDVVGEDYSDILHDAWSERMENPEYDYFSESIVEMAQLFSEQTKEGYLV